MTLCDPFLTGTTATNFAKTTRVELISQRKYYQTYEDVFGDVADGDKKMFNDYGVPVWGRT